MTEYNFSSLTLQIRENKLNNLTLYEKCDINLIDKLINSDLLQTIITDENRVYHYEKHQLINYKNLFVDGKAKVTYTRTKNYTFGRSNAKLGLQNIRLEIRHTLCRDKMIDIDMDNCHPNIQLQFLKKNGIDSPLLQSYIENRQYWFDLIISKYNLHTHKEVIKNKKNLKNMPKNMFIRIMYGGGIYQWCKDYDIEMIEIPKELNQFIIEINKNSQTIVNANLEIYNIVKRNKIEEKKIEYDEIDKECYYIQTEDEKKSNKKKQKYILTHSVVSYIMQELEITLLEIIFMYCIENKLIKNNVAVLASDGIMIETKYYNANLLTKFQEIIKKKTGFDITFSNKVMDEDYLKILHSKLNYKLYLDTTFTSGPIASYFKTMYSDKFIFNNGILYQYNNVYWKKCDSKKNAVLHNFIDTQFVKDLLTYISDIIVKQNKVIIKIENDEILKQELLILQKINAFSINIITHLRNIKKRVLIVDEIINKITCDYIEFDTDIYLLAFENKILDLKTNDFKTPEYTDYISLTTGYDYVDHNRYELKNRIMQIIVQAIPNEDDRNYYLSHLSTVLSGEHIQKVLVTHGGGANSKSLLSGILMLAMGQYGYILPSTILLNELKNENANPIIKNLDRKRVVLTSEIPNTKKINSSTLKEITGNSEICARGLYSSNTKVTMNMTLIMEVNAIPKIDESSYAVERRLCMTRFTSSFLPKEKYDLYTEQEKIDNNYFLENTYLVSDEFKQTYKQGFIDVLRDYYEIYLQNDFKISPKSASMIQYEKSYLESSDDLFSWFLSQYETANIDENKIIYVNDIYTIFKTTVFYENLSKSNKRDFNKNSFIKKIYENIHFKQIIKPSRSYHNGKRETRDYIINYKLIVDEDEEDNKITFQNC